MLNNLSEQIRECLQHAEDCARKAAAQTDPKLKEDFLDMERRWLFLARSYEFTERISDFSAETKRQAKQSKASLFDQAIVLEAHRADHTVSKGAGVRSRTGRSDGYRIREYL
jgi:hypothetical protein